MNVIYVETDHFEEALLPRGCRLCETHETLESMRLFTLACDLNVTTEAKVASYLRAMRWFAKHLAVSTMSEWIFTVDDPDSPLPPGCYIQEVCAYDEGGRQSYEVAICHIDEVDAEAFLKFFEEKGFVNSTIDL
ncbi:hypothetical protein [Hydrogenimonas sp.]|uniref:hypothetical protein n=1 Tax=Hydrogenimonas sp. TaxID=2231112 RepID=UPI002609E403|nr:hypothetical protein [Hydrogenimonas sp.]